MKATEVWRVAAGLMFIALHRNLKFRENKSDQKSFHILGFFRLKIYIGRKECVGGMTFKRYV